MNPARVILIETAGRNPAVEVRDASAGSVPRYAEDAEEADPGSEMPRVGCDFEHGLSCGAEEQIVEQAGYPADRVGLTREGKVKTTWK